MITTTLEQELKSYTDLANEAAFEVFGMKNTCISTSFALQQFLVNAGFEDAAVVRVELSIHHRGQNRCTGSSAGREWPGNPRRAASKGGWNGHLAVQTSGFVLDATADQLETGCGLSTGPLVYLKPEGWDIENRAAYYPGGTRFDHQDGELMVTHGRHRRQVGWKSTPAARRSAWSDVLAVMSE